MKYINKYIKCWVSDSGGAQAKHHQNIVPLSFISLMHNNSICVPI